MRADTMWRASILAAALLTCEAVAQVPLPPIERLDRSPDARQQRGLDAPAQWLAPNLVLPTSPAAGAAPPLLSSGTRVFVRQFLIRGNTVFTDAELHALVAPFENRDIGTEELEDVRNHVSRHYIDAGYINSGALIPDQSVVEGRITIQVVEGRLSAIDVAGENHFHPDFIRARLASNREAPLNVNQLQQRMQLLLQNPQIERINAELAPGIRPGEAVLMANVKEAERFSVLAGLANHSSPGIGGVRAELRGLARNIFGRGDVLSLLVGQALGMNDFSAGFDLPVSVDDTQLSLRYDSNRALIVEAPFDRIDIKNTSKKVEVAVSHPFIRTLSRDVHLGLSLSRRSSETFLLGEPYSFSPGVSNGKSVVSALRLSADWVERRIDRVVAARLSLSRGLDAFGSTMNGDGLPSSLFTSWLGQFQWAERLGSGQLIFRADGQRANKALLPMEKFAVGGADSVRGYREVRLVGDHGWTSSIEYRHPLEQLALPGIAGDGPREGRLSLALFIDAGRAWDSNPAAPPQKTLVGLGPGVRWEAGGWQAHVYKGLALTRIENAGHDWQDRGIHFRFSYQRAL